MKKIERKDIKSVSKGLCLQKLSKVEEEIAGGAIIKPAKLQPMVIGFNPIDAIIRNADGNLS